MWNLGFRVWILGFKVWNLRFKVWNLGFRVWHLLEGSGFIIGCLTQGLGFRFGIYKGVGV